MEPEGLVPCLQIHHWSLHRDKTQFIAPHSIFNIYFNIIPHLCLHLLSGYYIQICFQNPLMHFVSVLHVTRAPSISSSFIWLSCCNWARSKNYEPPPDAVFWHSSYFNLCPNIVLSSLLSNTSSLSMSSSFHCDPNISLFLGFYTECGYGKVTMFQNSS